jgi:hypothetical protein
MLSPLIKFCFNVYVQIQIAKISNPSRVMLHIDNPEGGRKTLELTSTHLKLSDIHTSLKTLNDKPELLQLPVNINKEKIS